MVTRGITQTASLWTEEDGTPEEFMQFCIDNFCYLKSKINSSTIGTVVMFYNIKISQAELGERVMTREISVRIK